MRAFSNFVCGFILSLLLTAAAFGQATNFGITPTGVTQTFSVTSVSSTITLNTTPGNTVLVQNIGSNIAYVKGGASASTLDFPIQPGYSILLNYPPGQVIAAITAASTTTLLVSKGLGSTALTVGGTFTPSPSPSSGITPIVGGSAISSLVLKNTPGNLYSAYAVCTSACWLMVFNATSAPSNGATTAGNAASDLVECVPIGAGSIGGVNYGLGPPAVYSTGITAVISSTACSTLTLSTVGFIHGTVQ